MHFQTLPVICVSFLVWCGGPAKVSAQRSEPELRTAIAEIMSKPENFLSVSDKNLGDDYAAAVPIVLEELRRSENYDPKGALAIARADLAFSLLREEDRANAVEQVAAAIADAAQLRKVKGADILVKCASPAAVEPLKKLLADKDPKVVLAAADAVDRYFYTNGEESTDWAAGMYDALAAVSAGPAGAAACPVSALLHLDAKKAEPLVTSPPVMDKANPAVVEVIDALNERNIAVKDIPLLKALYSDAFTRSKKTGDAAEAAAGDMDTLLRALARAKAPEAEKLIAARLAIPRPAKEQADWSEARGEAFGMLLMFHGYTYHPAAYLRNVCAKDPTRFAKLSPAQQAAMLVLGLDWNLSDDDGEPVESLTGFLAAVPPSQYAATVTGLKTIGAAKAAAALGEGLKALGKTQLPEDADARESAIDELDERTNAALKKAIPGLIKSEPLDVTLFQFIIRNRAEFPNPTPEELKALRGEEEAEEDE